LLTDPYSSSSLFLIPIPYSPYSLFPLLLIPLFLIPYSLFPIPDGAGSLQRGGRNAVPFQCNSAALNFFPGVIPPS